MKKDPPFTKQVLNFCLLVYTISCVLTAQAQNENAKWYFGGNVALDFMTNPPTVLTNGALSTMEGCSTISDASGNLLFYSDGIKVWNQQHAVMANGTGLMGNSSSTQAALIVKKPGSSNLYFVFTQGTGTTGGGPFGYSVVDMALAAGMGSVTVKNVTLVTESTEKLAAVRHCNGEDVWILTHDRNADFRVYSLTSNGLNPTPVMSYSVGTTHAWAGIGCLKASPDGSKLAACFGSKVELYDFHTATGVVSNPLALGSYTYAYGCEFSPDGTKLYASESPLTLPNKPVHQWDLCAGSPQAILASHNIVGNVTGVNEAGSFQLGINGKIYVSRYYSNTIGVINNPNAYGTACNFVNMGVSLMGNNCLYGFQNCINDFLKPATPACYASDCNKITTSVGALSQNEGIRVYPNPVNSTLNLEVSGRVRCLILDQVGGTVFERWFESGEHSIDLSAFSTGIYTVKLETAEGMRVQRIVKAE